MPNSNNYMWPWDCDQLSYTNTSGQNIPNNNATTLLNWTKIYDRNSVNFNFVLGIYSVPKNGQYLISGKITYNAVLPLSLGSTFALYTTVNGAVVSVAERFTEALISTARPIQMPSKILSLSVGDQLAFQAYQNSGLPCNVSSTANQLWMTILQLG